MEFLKEVSLSILVVIMFATPTCGKAITCNAGDFAAGEVGRILCYFPDDIDAHHSVFIQYCPSSAPTDASATGVLLCKTEDVRASKCNEQDGYVLKSHTRNTILIEVVNITEKAAGRYNCQFLPPDKSPREMCSLTVRAKTTGVTPAEEGDRDSDVLDEGKDSSPKTVHPDETGTLEDVFLSVNAVVSVVYIIVAIKFPLCLRSLEMLRGMAYLILVAIMFATPTCGKAITCNAGDFAAGEVGRILCYFPDDIDAHHSVFIQYYPSSAPTDASATGVLLCKTEDVRASKCNEQDGYVLKSHTRNTLLVEIVNITEKAAGRYNCQFLPPDHSPREMCSLTVRAKTTGVTPTGEGDRDSDVLDEGKDSSTQTVHPDETGTVSVSTLVGVIVAFIVVAAVVCIIVFVFRLRR